MGGSEKETKKGSSCPVQLTSWLPEIRRRPSSNTALCLSLLEKKNNNLGGNTLYALFKLMSNQSNCWVFKQAEFL